jgi:hypothetical protein
MTKQKLGLTGSIVLFVGVFLPIVSLPMVGSMNYFQNGKGDGTIIIVLAIISLFMVLSKRYKGLWYTGIGSLAVLIVSLINAQIKISEAKTKMNADLADNPFRGIADLAMQSVQLQWGWAIMIIGAVLLIAAAAIKEPAPPELIHSPTE